MSERASTKTGNAKDPKETSDQKQWVKNKADLPVWFDLKKYDATVKFDPTWWYEQLILRAWLHKDRETLEFSLRRELQIVREHIENGGAIICAPDYATIVEELDSGVLAYLKGHYTNDHVPGGISSVTSIVDSTQDSIGRFGYLKIDFLIPEDLLARKFLSYIRKKKAVSYLSKYNDTKIKSLMKKWHRQRILPYLDLHLWERLNSKNITDGFMAKTLWSDGPGGNEDIRKTVKKNAAMAISLEETLLPLAAYLADRKMRDIS